MTVELGDANGRVEDAAEIVRTLDGASEVTVDGRHVRARVPNGAQAIPSILSALDGPRLRGRFGDDGPPVARRRLPPLHGPRLRDRGRGRRLMQLLRQTGWMIVRQLRNLMREPIWIALMIIQPLIWLLLYGQLFSRVGALRGGASSYIEFLTPGIVCMNAFFGGSWSGMAMITDLNRHVIDRFLAAPASRFAIVLSQVVRAGITAVIQALILLSSASRSASACTAASPAGSSSSPRPRCSR